jgi:hypothetical protein
VTVLLASPGRSEIFSTDVQNSSISLNLTQAYYGFWAFTAFSETVTVVLLTIANTHFNLMSSEDEMIWFILYWDFYTQMLPQIFLTAGCICMGIGCMIGSFLVGNNITGVIVCAIGGFLIVLVLLIWFRMLSVNKQKQFQNREILQKIFSEYIQRKGV